MLLHTRALSSTLLLYIYTYIIPLLAHYKVRSVAKWCLYRRIVLWMYFACALPHYTMHKVVRKSLKTATFACLLFFLSMCECVCVYYIYVIIIIIARVRLGTASRLVLCAPRDPRAAERPTTRNAWIVALMHQRARARTRFCEQDCSCSNVYMCKYI